MVIETAKQLGSVSAPPLVLELGMEGVKNVFFLRPVGQVLGNLLVERQ